MAEKDEFNHFSYLIIFVLIMYTVILLIFLCVRRRQIAVARESDNPDAIQFNIDYAAYTFELTTKFEDVLQTTLGSQYKWILAAYRVVAFLYFFIIGCIMNGVTQSDAFNFFENWCAFLVMLYFLLACIAHFVKWYSDRSRSALDIRLNAQADYTLKVRILGMLVHLGFEVAGGTSLFVMVLVYTMGDRDASGFNSVHFLTFVGMAGELALNTLKVRFDQYPAAVAFLVLYLLAVWPGIFTGSIPYWPYPQMSTATQACFQRYFIAFALNFALYVAWYGLYKLKKILLVLRHNYFHRDTEVEMPRSTERGGAESEQGSVGSARETSVYNPTVDKTGNRQHQQQAPPPQPVVVTGAGGWQQPQYPTARFAGRGPAAGGRGGANAERDLNRFAFGMSDSQYSQQSFEDSHNGGGGGYGGYGGYGGHGGYSGHGQRSPQPLPPRPAGNVNPFFAHQQQQRQSPHGQQQPPFMGQQPHPQQQYSQQQQYHQQPHPQQPYPNRGFNNNHYNSPRGPPLPPPPPSYSEASNNNHSNYATAPAPAAGPLTPPPRPPAQFTNYRPMENEEDDEEEEGSA